jgi:hypothetical protein
MELSRNDFLSLYLGHSYIKTIKVLEKNKDKDIIIDKSSLILSNYDVFAKEALQTIEKYMRDNPDHHIKLI